MIVTDTPVEHGEIRAQYAKEAAAKLEAMKPPPPPEDERRPG